MQLNVTGDDQSVAQDAVLHQQAVQQQQHYDTSGGQQTPTSPHPVTSTNSDGTFRQPLPPALARPRLLSQANVIRTATVGVRHPVQGLDPRLQVM